MTVQEENTDCLFALSWQRASGGRDGLLFNWKWLRKPGKGQVKEGDNLLENGLGQGDWARHKGQERLQHRYFRDFWE